MTWLDGVLIVSLVVFLALGAKVGSLWTGACLVGGFIGAFLVDCYGLPVSQLLGKFPGSYTLTVSFLFLAGVLAALVPGWILNRLTGMFFLGFIDSVAGLITGVFAWFITVTLVFLLVLPKAPAVEKNAAWKNSMFAKPLYLFVEDLFNDRHFRREPTSVTEDFVKEFTPVVESAEKGIKKVSETVVDNLVDKVKKK